MSTDSKYSVNGNDLSTIFYPLSSGGTAQTTPTGYLYNAGTSQNPDYKDLINLFASYITSTTPAPTTYYTSNAYNNKDLSEIFQNINVPPSIYTIDSSSNLLFTEYNNNNYKGLVFEVNDISNIANATITFNQNITNSTIIIIGAGGGGGFDAGSGGGGGGATILSSIIQINSGNSFDIIVGNGGAGGVGTQSNTNGVKGGDTSFDSYISYGGEGGGGVNSNIGGGMGGNINTIHGGGGGGGGGSGVPPPGSSSLSPINSGGTGGKNVNNSNIGTSGQDLTYQAGQQGVSGYNYAGTGGNSYYYENTIPIYVPFYNSVTSSINVSGGGGGGGSGIYINPDFAGGFCGNGGGGGYGFVDANAAGQTAQSNISIGYGNGGGGGSSPGGAGGNGVVIIYWQTS